MPNDASEILSSALKLSPIDRAQLIEQLLSSFEFTSRTKIDTLWAKEAEDRIDAYENNQLSSSPAKDVFNKLL